MAMRGVLPGIADPGRDCNTVMDRSRDPIPIKEKMNPYNTLIKKKKLVPDPT